jgi:hypothetical protein
MTSVRKMSVPTSSAAGEGAWSGSKRGEGTASEKSVESEAATGAGIFISIFGESVGATCQPLLRATVWNAFRTIAS